MFERNLPPYLAHDLEAWKKGVEEILFGAKDCLVAPCVPTDVSSVAH